MPIDILIVCHNKDDNKLPYVVNSLDKLQMDIGNIHIISDVSIEFKSNFTDKIITHKEEAILEKVDFPYRSNWIYQQLLKLFQNVTQDKYLTIDADVIFNKNLSIEEYTFFLGRTQYHKPYFNFLSKLGIERKANHSFINEIMFFDREIIKTMLKSINMTSSDFIKFCEKTITDDCYLSEFELYGNYVNNNFPDLYKTKQLDCPLLGKYFGYKWEDSEIEETIERMKKTDADFFTIHSWT